MRYSQVQSPGTGSLVPDFQLPAMGGRVRLSDFANQKNVVLYLMRRFTCSRCWHDAAMLGQLQNLFKSYNAAVLLIGGGSYLGPATRLAAELELPFPVLADTNGDAWRRVIAGGQSAGKYYSATAIVDFNGILRYLHRGSLPAINIDTQSLIDAISRLDSRISG